VHTALVRKDEIFLSCGWNKGGALLKVSGPGDHFRITEQYRIDGGGGVRAFDAWIGNSWLIDEHICTNAGVCIELKTGKVIWQAPFGKKVSMVVAEGELYYRLSDGTMVLVDANPG